MMCKIMMEQHVESNPVNRVTTKAATERLKKLSCIVQLYYSGKSMLSNCIIQESQ